MARINFDRLSRMIVESIEEKESTYSVTDAKEKGGKMPKQVILRLEDDYYNKLEVELEEDGVSFDASYSYRLKDPKDIDCLINFLKLARSYYE